LLSIIIIIIVHLHRSLLVVLVQITLAFLRFLIFSLITSALGLGELLFDRSSMNSIHQA